jgi:hypothetical protein
MMKLWDVKAPKKTCSDVEIPAAVVVVWQAPKGERLEVDAKLTLADGGPVFPPTPGLLKGTATDFGRILVSLVSININHPMPIS